MLTAKNIKKKYGQVEVLKGVDLAINNSEIVCVVGSSGAGKSTLLQVLSGALGLNEGQGEWKSKGLDIEPNKVYLQIAIAAPYFELIEEMTAKEFLTFHSSFKGYIDSAPIDDIIGEAGLLNAADKQIRFFSSGMKQRLKLAQAIFSDVPAILLDEPCTNLDTAGFDLYYKWIENYCKNRLVVISSNDKNEYHFCDHQINIQDYKLIKPTVYN